MEVRHLVASSPSFVSLTVSREYTRLLRAKCRHPEGIVFPFHARCGNATRCFSFLFIFFLIFFFFLIFMSCASRHYRGHTRKRERGGGEQRFGFDVTLKEQSLHSMLLCHRCSRSINSRCSYYPPPIETFARANIAPLPLSLHYHRCHD